MTALIIFVVWILTRYHFNLSWTSLVHHLMNSMTNLLSFLIRWYDVSRYETLSWGLRCYSTNLIPKVLLIFNVVLFFLTSSYLSASNFCIKMLIENSYAAIVIGKGGSHLKSFQEESGAGILIIYYVFVYFVVFSHLYVSIP